MPLTGVEPVVSLSGKLRRINYNRNWHRSEHGKNWLKKWRRKRYLKHRDSILENNRKWQQNNKDLIRKIKQRYKAKRRGLIPAPSLSILNTVYRRCTNDSGEIICILCLRPVSKNTLSIEHLTPVTRGGTNTLENLWIAHRKCNSSKNNRMLWEYRLDYAINRG